MPRRVRSVQGRGVPMSHPQTSSRKGNDDPTERESTATGHTRTYTYRSAASVRDIENTSDLGDGDVESSRRGARSRGGRSKKRSSSSTSDTSTYSDGNTFLSTVEEEEAKSGHHFNLKGAARGRKCMVFLFNTRTLLYRYPAYDTFTVAKGFELDGDGGQVGSVAKDKDAEAFESDIAPYFGISAGVRKGRPQRGRDAKSDTARTKRSRGQGSVGSRTEEGSQAGSRREREPALGGRSFADGGGRRRETGEQGVTTVGTLGKKGVGSKAYDSLTGDLSDDDDDVAFDEERGWGSSSSSAHSDTLSRAPSTSSSFLSEPRRALKEEVRNLTTPSIGGGKGVRNVSSFRSNATHYDGESNDKEEGRGNSEVERSSLRRKKARFERRKTKPKYKIPTTNKKEAGERSSSCSPGSSSALIGTDSSSKSGEDTCTSSSSSYSTSFSSGSGSGRSSSDSSLFHSSTDTSCSSSTSGSSDTSSSLPSSSSTLYSESLSSSSTVSTTDRDMGIVLWTRDTHQFVDDLNTAAQRETALLAGVLPPITSVSHRPRGFFGVGGVASLTVANDGTTADEGSIRLAGKGSNTAHTTAGQDTLASGFTGGLAVKRETDTSATPGLLQLKKDQQQQQQNATKQTVKYSAAELRAQRRSAQLQREEEAKKKAAAASEAGSQERGQAIPSKGQAPLAEPLDEGGAPTPRVDNPSTNNTDGANSRGGSSAKGGKGRYDMPTLKYTPPNNGTTSGGTISGVGNDYSRNEPTRSQQVLLGLPEATLGYLLTANIGCGSSPNVKQNGFAVHRIGTSALLLIFPVAMRSANSNKTASLSQDYPSTTIAGGPSAVALGAACVGNVTNASFSGSPSASSPHSIGGTHGGGSSLLLSRPLPGAASQLLLPPHSSSLSPHQFSPSQSLNTAATVTTVRNASFGRRPTVAFGASPPSGLGGGIGVGGAIGGAGGASGLEEYLSPQVTLGGGRGGLMGGSFNSTNVLGDGVSLRTSLNAANLKLAGGPNSNTNDRGGAGDEDDPCSWEDDTLLVDKARGVPPIDGLLMASAAVDGGGALSGTFSASRMGLGSQSSDLFGGGGSASLRDPQQVSSCVPDEPDGAAVPLCFACSDVSPAAGIGTASSSQSSHSNATYPMPTALTSIKRHNSAPSIASTCSPPNALPSSIATVPLSRGRQTGNHTNVFSPTNTLSDVGAGGGEVKTNDRSHKSASHPQGTHSSSLFGTTLSNFDARHTVPEMDHTIARLVIAIDLDDSEGIGGGGSSQGGLRRAGGGAGGAGGIGSADTNSIGATARFVQIFINALEREEIRSGYLTREFEGMMAAMSASSSEGQKQPQEDGGAEEALSLWWELQQLARCIAGEDFGSALTLGATIGGLQRQNTNKDSSAKHSNHFLFTSHSNNVLQRFQQHHFSHHLTLNKSLHVPALYLSHFTANDSRIAFLGSGRRQVLATARHSFPQEWVVILNTSANHFVRGGGFCHSCFIRETLAPRYAFVMGHSGARALTIEAVRNILVSKLGDPPHTIQKLTKFLINEIMQQHEKSAAALTPSSPQSAVVSPPSTPSPSTAGKQQQGVSFYSLNNNSLSPPSLGGAILTTTTNGTLTSAGGGSAVGGRHTPPPCIFGGNYGAMQAAGISPLSNSAALIAGGVRTCSSRANAKAIALHQQQALALIDNADAVFFVAQVLELLTLSRIVTLQRPTLTTSMADLVPIRQMPIAYIRGGTMGTAVYHYGELYAAVDEDHDSIIKKARAKGIKNFASSSFVRQPAPPTCVIGSDACTVCQYLARSNVARRNERRVLRRKAQAMEKAAKKVAMLNKLRHTATEDDQRLCRGLSPAMKDEGARHLLEVSLPKSFSPNLGFHQASNASFSRPHRQDTREGVHEEEKEGHAGRSVTSVSSARQPPLLAATNVASSFISAPPEEGDMKAERGQIPFIIDSVVGGYGDAAKVAEEPPLSTVKSSPLPLDREDLCCGNNTSKDSLLLKIMPDFLTIPDISEVRSAVKHVIIGEDTSYKSDGGGGEDDTDENTEDECESEENNNNGNANDEDGETFDEEGECSAGGDFESILKRVMRIPIHPPMLSSSSAAVATPNVNTQGGLFSQPLPAVSVVGPSLSLRGPVPELVPHTESLSSVVPPASHMSTVATNANSSASPYATNNASFSSVAAAAAQSASHGVGGAGVHFSTAPKRTAVVSANTTSTASIGEAEVALGYGDLYLTFSKSQQRCEGTRKRSGEGGNISSATGRSVSLSGGEGGSKEGVLRARLHKINVGGADSPSLAANDRSAASNSISTTMQNVQPNVPFESCSARVGVDGQPIPTLGLVPKTGCVDGIGGGSVLGGQSKGPGRQSGAKHPSSAGTSGGLPSSADASHTTRSEEAHKPINPDLDLERLLFSVPPSQPSEKKSADTKSGIPLAANSNNTTFQEAISSQQENDLDEQIAQRVLRNLFIHALSLVEEGEIGGKDAAQRTCAAFSEFVSHSLATEAFSASSALNPFSVPPSTLCRHLTASERSLIESLALLHQYRSNNSTELLGRAWLSCSPMVKQEVTKGNSVCSLVAEEMAYHHHCQKVHGAAKSPATQPHQPKSWLSCEFGDIPNSDASVHVQQGHRYTAEGSPIHYGSRTSQTCVVASGIGGTRQDESDSGKVRPQLSAATTSPATTDRTVPNTVNTALQQQTKGGVEDGLVEDEGGAEGHIDSLSRGVTFMMADRRWIANHPSLALSVGGGAGVSPPSPSRTHLDSPQTVTTVPTNCSTASRSLLQHTHRDGSQMGVGNSFDSQKAPLQPQSPLAFAERLSTILQASPSVGLAPRNVVPYPIALYIVSQLMLLQWWCGRQQHTLKEMITSLKDPLRTVGRGLRRARGIMVRLEVPIQTVSTAVISVLKELLLDDTEEERKPIAGASVPTSVSYGMVGAPCEEEDHNAPHDQFLPNSTSFSSPPPHVLSHGPHVLFLAQYIALSCKQGELRTGNHENGGLRRGKDLVFEVADGGRSTTPDDTLAGGRYNSFSKEFLTDVRHSLFISLVSCHRLLPLEHLVVNYSTTERDLALASAAAERDVASEAVHHSGQTDSSRPTDTNALLPAAYRREESSFANATSTLTRDANDHSSLSPNTVTTTSASLEPPPPLDERNLSHHLLQHRFVCMYVSRNPPTCAAQTLLWSSYINWLSAPHDWAEGEDEVGNEEHEEDEGGAMNYIHKSHQTALAGDPSNPFSSSSPLLHDATINMPRCGWGIREEGGSENNSFPRPRGGIPLSGQRGSFTTEEGRVGAWSGRETPPATSARNSYLLCADLGLLRKACIASKALALWDLILADSHSEEKVAFSTQYRQHQHKGPFSSSSASAPPPPSIPAWAQSASSSSSSLITLQYCYYVLGIDPHILAVCAGCQFYPSRMSALIARNHVVCSPKLASIVSSGSCSSNINVPQGRGGGAESGSGSKLAAASGDASCGVQYDTKCLPSSRSTSASVLSHCRSAATAASTPPATPIGKFAGVLSTAKTTSIGRGGSCPSPTDRKECIPRIPQLSPSLSSTSAVNYMSAGSLLASARAAAAAYQQQQCAAAPSSSVSPSLGPLPNPLSHTLLPPQAPGRSHNKPPYRPMLLHAMPQVAASSTTTEEKEQLGYHVLLAHNTINLLSDVVFVQYVPVPLEVTADEEDECSLAGGGGDFEE